MNQIGIAICDACGTVSRVRDSQMRKFGFAPPPGLNDDEPDTSTVRQRCGLHVHDGTCRGVVVFAGYVDVHPEKRLTLGS